MAAAGMYGVSDAADSAPGMVHLRIIAPGGTASRVHTLLCSTASAINVISVPAASTNPSGDLIMCDVTRGDASVIISELRDRGLAHETRSRVAEAFTGDEHALSKSISSPDAFAFIVALCAGAAGMLSLSTAKSGALIGVLISVTTIPAAANIGIAAAYGDWDTFAGSTGQLAVNLAAILIAGTTTLYVQRLLSLRRKRLSRRS